MAATNQAFELKGALLGSVTRRLVNVSPRPVLVVRQSGHAALLRPGSISLISISQRRYASLPIVLEEQREVVPVYVLPLLVAGRAPEDPPAAGGVPPGSPVASAFKAASSMFSRVASPRRLVRWG